MLLCCSASRLSNGTGFIRMFERGFVDMSWEMVGEGTEFGVRVVGDEEVVKEVIEVTDGSTVTEVWLLAVSRLYGEKQEGKWGKVRGTGFGFIGGIRRRDIWIQRMVWWGGRGINIDQEWGIQIRGTIMRCLNEGLPNSNHGMWINKSKRSQHFSPNTLLVMVHMYTLSPTATHLNLRRNLDVHIPPWAYTWEGYSVQVQCKDLLSTLASLCRIPHRLYVHNITKAYFTLIKHLTEKHRSRSRHFW